MVDCVDTVISSIFNKISHKYLFSVSEHLFCYKSGKTDGNDNIFTHSWEYA